MKKILLITAFLMGLTAIGYSQDTTDDKWEDQSNGDVVIAPTFNGNVGIGISAPLHKLHVEGDIYTSGSIKVGAFTAFEIYGQNNLIVGVNHSLSSGTNNTFFGQNAGRDIVSSSNNTFIGNHAGVASTGKENTYIGSKSGYTGGIGDKNTFIGFESGNLNSSGNENTYLGRGAGYSNASGAKNIFIGSGSGFSYTSGNNNIIIGTDAANTKTGGNGNIFIGGGSGGSFSANESSKLDIGGAIFGDLNTNVVGIGTHNLETGNTLTVAGSTFIKGTGTTGLTIESGGTNQNSYINFNEESVFASSIFWNGINDRLQIISTDDLQLEVGDGKTVYIGTSTKAGNLKVKGLVNSSEVKVEATITVPDYVFADDYDLPTLQETENYIKANHHLPEIPSAKEIEKDGIDLGVMNLKLLKKIEELTLHMIELQKENQQMKERMNKLENK